MTLVMVLLTIAVVAGVAALVAGLVSGGLGEPDAPIPARALPEGPLTGRDVTDLRFVQAFRGYRMDQVDAAMDGLAAEIDRLRALVPGEAGQTGSPSRGFEPEAGAVPAGESTTSNDSVSVGDPVPAGAEPGTDADGRGERSTWPSDFPAGRD